MPAAKTDTQPQLLFVDGSFEELAKEMADYLKAEDAKQLLSGDKTASRDEVLQKLVAASSALRTVPEKEYTAASNLMVHLVLQSADPKKYLPMLCANFAKPMSNSPVHGVGLSLNALSTVFNLLEAADPIRARVLMEILKFLKSQGMFDILRPYLERLPEWLDTWETDEEMERKIYEEVADVAAEAGAETESYEFLLKALRTFDADDKDELASPDAQRLALRAARAAILDPSHFLFHDLRAIPSVQALADSHPVYSQLLDVVAEQDVEDFVEFCAEHDGWLAQQRLVDADDEADDDKNRLLRKMRLLTFASLAAAVAPAREIPYARICDALRIPPADVEKWTIDVVRAGLVEGKLSQQRQVFLVHKVTYRVFGHKQYRELATRIDHWRNTLANVLVVVRQEQAIAQTAKDRGGGGDAQDSLQQQQQQQQQQDRTKSAAAGGGGGNSIGNQGGGGRRERQQRERTDNDD